MSQTGGVTPGPDELIAFAYGLVAGTPLAALLVYWFLRRQALRTSWIAVVLFCTAVMGVAAVRADDIKLWQAMMVILIGSPALVAAARAIELIGQGETIEMQSQWGGLGGALGGWRLSPVTSLMLVALAFTGAAIGVAMPSKQTDSRDTKSASGKTTAASSETANQKAPVKPEPATAKASEKDAKPAPTDK
jgi:hypothetical protein